MVKKAILDVGHGAVGLGTIRRIIRSISNPAVALRSQPGLARRNLQIVILGNFKINDELFLQVLMEGMV